ncbi:MAG TPA: lipase maturation factor family protein [Gammaproteobacteria bacterium]|nr:lipase maturation factor family protein [Gammaproteobacteria bacterium]
MKSWFSLSPAHDYRLVSQLFLKGLAVIYFSAFLSLSVQINGLAGPHGILPLIELEQFYFQEFGTDALWMLPSLFWLNASDIALFGATVLGCALSVLLLFGLYQRLALIGLFLLYLSLTTAGQIFLNFQWDYLLLESGFLAIFLVDGPTRLLIFLYHWLLFRLRFLSGLSKLLSGDPVWRDWTALQHYFETQPLPHFGSWVAHQLPDIILRAGTGLVYLTELIVPFFIFLPRPFRIAAALLTVFMQLLIILTSNHNFINLLTILLCLFLIDDRSLMGKKHAPTTGSFTGKRWPQVAAALLIFSISLPLMYQMILHREPPVLAEWSKNLRRFGLGNVYHVFPTMQTERQELIIQGSNDHVHWKTYPFKYKPGPLNRLPPFILPHQPRLDWMIWFVPARHESSRYWFDRFMAALKQGNPTVLRLLADNPFPDRPPRYLRVLAYRYHFNTFAEKRQTGNYWRRELLGEFPNVPPRRP